MPVPVKGESKPDFLKRCIPQLVKEGNEGDQAVAVCNAIYDKKKTTTKLNSVLKVSSVDMENHLVFGWAYVSKKDGEQTLDHSNTFVKIESIEKAAYDYAMNYRVGGEMHKKEVAVMVESMVFSADKQKTLGIDLGLEGWWIGMYVPDDGVMKKINSGEYSAFSIGGTAVEVEVA